MNSSEGGDDSREKLYQLVLELSNPETRESALLELSKKREAFPDLAPILWNSFGTIATLLQEIVCIYPLLAPPTLTAHASNRVCNALALLQCDTFSLFFAFFFFNFSFQGVASHPDTRTHFLKGILLLYISHWVGLTLFFFQLTFRFFCILSSTQSARPDLSSTCV